MVVGKRREFFYTLKTTFLSIKSNYWIFRARKTYFYYYRKQKVKIDQIVGDKTKSGKKTSRDLPSFLSLRYSDSLPPK
jgi:hypothetical protein